MMTLHEFLRQRPSGNIYHYTSAVGMLGIVSKKELWATNVHHLNDSQEYQRALALLIDELRKRAATETKANGFWSDSLKQMSEDSQFSACGVVSFSTNPNQLSQWRAYCPNGGYSIGLGYKELKFAIRTSRAFLVKCVYGESEQRILISAALDYYYQAFVYCMQRRTIDRWSFLSHIQRKLDAAMLACKDEGFKEESEWRLIVQSTTKFSTQFRPGRFGIVPYFSVPLCPEAERPRFVEVYIGPNPEPEVANRALWDFLAERGTKANWKALGMPIKNSGSPYRY